MKENETLAAVAALGIRSGGSAPSFALAKKQNVKNFFLLQIKVEKYDHKYVFVVWIHPKCWQCQKSGHRKL